MYNTHMEEINLKLDNETWILGVSGGSDSMALLDICYKQHISIVVAHMNYQLRDTANRDMDIVSNYCQKRNIPFHCKYQEKTCHHNFQAFARKERYAFYHELIEQYHAIGVMVAHQLDDVLETFYMQTLRKSTPSCYGISETIQIMNCLVYRPLLGYTKQDLKDYCEENEIEYGEDESNASRKYLRNRIRMDIIQNLSLDEKKEILNKIQVKNDEQQLFQSKILDFYHTWKHDVSSLQALSKSEQIACIDHMIYESEKKHISKKEIEAILSQMKCKNFSKEMKKHNLQCCYGKIEMVKKQKPFAYHFDHIEFMETPYFEIKKHGELIESLTLEANDFPITIRSAQKEDKIRLRFGTKSVHRWFIDRKIPWNEREIWPVVENAQQNIIFVSKIGCDIEHFSNNPTVFVIK